MATAVTGEPDFPFSRADPYAPPPQVAALRAAAPVAAVRLAGGRRAWLVTRHADVRTVLGDPRFSSDVSRPGFPMVQAAAPAAVPPAAFMALDPPRHTRYRSALIHEFGPRRIAALRPVIGGLVDGQIARMRAAGGPADLVEHLALPVPSLVICALLGVPFGHVGYFQQRSRVVLSRSAATGEVNRANRELAELIAGVIEAKRAEPGDDVLSRLIRHEAGFTVEEMTTMAVVLLTAGHETTAGMISSGVLTLVREPGVWAALARHPERTGPLVEELLRLLTVLQFGVPRTATADLVLGGVRIRSGEGVIALLAGGNLDPDAYPDPGRLDPRRSGPRHLAFGHGIHLCLGHSLARAELSIVFEAAFRAFPDLRMAVPEKHVEFAENAFVYSPDKLMVDW
ncbi:cytochrome P450 [Amycolatopsis sp. PS_44_ISF1]|uniref:cytochrome P450 n=1 Tax=Amycolatopsis sp. PS_44_ISF1 TaxID=2974917 RepID=UPI0028DE962D|nr:cytochrome P450 [Amycolatopsis sp. PS_44_ISF1]MDT8913509.1 cytochrome P450 [Amycolatopsis sp. PS_44_ISF1]